MPLQFSITNDAFGTARPASFIKVIQINMDFLLNQTTVISNVYGDKTSYVGNFSPLTTRTDIFSGVGVIIDQSSAETALNKLKDLSTSVIIS